MSFTFVTALYNINRAKYDNRDYTQYREWFSRTLTIPVPMVIYTEECNREIIDANRKNLPTKVIYTRLDETPFYYTRDKVRNIIENSSFKHTLQHPNGLENRCYDYIPIVNSKFVWMSNAISENYFQTDMHFWIDAGLSRFMHFDISKQAFNLQLINTLHQTNSIYIQIGKEKELVDLLGGKITFEDSIGKNINFMMAGFWGGNSQLVADICKQGADMYITEYIEKERVDNEQVIFGYIMSKYAKQLYLIRQHPGQEYINYYIFCGKI